MSVGYSPARATEERPANRWLLMCGVIGPPLFVIVFLIEGATRPGYSAWRHYVSQLSLGEGGWMQIANFLLYLSGAAGPCWPMLRHSWLYNTIFINGGVIAR